MGWFLSWEILQKEHNLSKEISCSIPCFLNLLCIVIVCRPYMNLFSVRKRSHFQMKYLYSSSKSKSSKHSATAHAFSLQSELKALHRKREKTEISHSIIGTLSSRLTYPWHVSSTLSIWINTVCWQCHAWLLYSYSTAHLYSTYAFWWWEHSELKKCGTF